MIPSEQLEQEHRRLTEELQILTDRTTELETALEQITTRKTFRFWQKCFGVSTLKQKIKVLERDYVDPSSSEGQYRLFFSRHYPTKAILRNQRQESQSLNNRPKISLLMPTYNSNPSHLKEAIESICRQSYDNWELCIADDASTDSEVIKIIRASVAEDKRIKFVLRRQNGHISCATNSALELATGEYIGLVDHDDLLWPNALFECVKAIERHPGAGLIYSDEDKVSSDGKIHLNPFFKPDWSPDYLRSINYITHFTVLSRRVIDQIGGLVSRYDGAQDWNLFLRATNFLTRESEAKAESTSLRDTIIHIPTILYSWRQSVTSAADKATMTGIKQYVIDAQRRVLVDDLQERGYSGSVEPSPYWTWRVRCQIKGNPKVSIIIVARMATSTADIPQSITSDISASFTRRFQPTMPAKDYSGLLERCVDSIIEESTYGNYEILLVNGGSQETKTAAFLRKFRTNRRIKILHWQKPFSYSAINNFVAKQAKGDYYLFLDGNTKVINPDWIESLLEFAQRSDVGAVGAKLLYPDDTIEHAGKILGLGGLAGHGHRLLPADSHGYHHRLSVSQNVSAVTAACVMIPRKIFEAVDGFDELYAPSYNDIDLCLKIRKIGKLVVYTPYAQLYHYESKTRGYEDSAEKLARFRIEKKRLLDKWGETIRRGDPYYNPNLTLLRDDFSLRDES